MTTESKQVLREALDLPPVERAELVERILASFDFPARQEIDALWAKEAEERIDAYDRGEISAKPANRVFDEIDRQQS
jgi:putative addiction module component (TIGR02574 family)